MTTIITIHDENAVHPENGPTCTFGPPEVKYNLDSEGLDVIEALNFLQTNFRIAFFSLKDIAQTVRKLHKGNAKLPEEYCVTIAKEVAIQIVSMRHKRPSDDWDGYEEARLSSYKGEPVDCFGMTLVQLK